jgi:putative CocE/NonD family hydrolase
MIRFRTLVLAAFVLFAGAPAHAADAPAKPADTVPVDLTFQTRLTLRDGVQLSATVYRPRGATDARPCVFELTPYIADSYHDRGMYFASHGVPFLVVDVRGRGNSGGTFNPFAQEVNDGYDVVEQIAKLPFCNGKVAMWGGSYAGFDQWAAAKNRPPHLATIVPVAAAHPGVDFPYQSNIGSPYLAQWLTFTAGKASQGALFGDWKLWADLWKQRYDRGEAFATLPAALGTDMPALREWLKHPFVDAWFDSMAPTDDDYRAMSLPILTITGSYDDDQPGALTYYRRYMKAVSPEQRAKHWLIIGPWDHAGTRTPKAEVGGLTFGPPSLVDLPALHVEWYRFAMQGGPRPEFLKKAVAWYLIGADEWRYADSFEAVTASTRTFYLDSDGSANRVFASGALTETAPKRAATDSYVYDPRDRSISTLEATTDPFTYTDQRLLFAKEGKLLVYHSAPFEQDVDVAGYFKLSAWLSIDQPDTDFAVTIYEITANGQSIRMTGDTKRARHRTSLRSETLVNTKEPLEYTFDTFLWNARRVAKGSRLRLVIEPIDSIWAQKNYNAAKPVSEQTLADARPVTVKLVHDAKHRSALVVPIAAR